VRRQFKETILELAKQDDRLVMVMGDVSVYLFAEFQELAPERFYNLGICENTIVSVAAGLSAQGFVPYVHSITPFITERCFEQIKLDVCYNRFPCTIVTCGASFDYAYDGASHHCFTDLAILRLLPEMEVIQPGSRQEVDALIRARHGSGAPAYFRLSDYPHGIDVQVTFGKGSIIRNAGAAVTIVTSGPLLGNVVDGCVDLSVNILYFPTIKPFDKDLISRYSHTRFLVIHDAFGLHEALTACGVSASYHGLPDAFLCCYGKLNDIRADIRLDPAGIREAVTAFARGG